MFKLTNAIDDQAFGMTATCAVLHGLTTRRSAARRRTLLRRSWRDVVLPVGLLLLLRRFSPGHRAQSKHHWIYSRVSLYRFSSPKRRRLRFKTRIAVSR